MTRLHEIAHARTGDKGDRSSIAVFAYDPADYPLLVERLTEDAVAAVFADRRPGRVQRFLLPHLGGMNFVIDDLLEGGVNSSLGLDRHGKTLSYQLLAMQIDRG